MFLYLRLLCFIMELAARDGIAVFTLGVGFALLASGVDGIVGSILLAVICFYFGAESLEKRKRG